MYQVRFPLSVVSFPNALRLNTLADPGRAGAPARLFILPPTVTLSGLRMERMGEASFLASLSAGDLAAGERLLQVGHPVIRHLGAAPLASSAFGSGQSWILSLGNAAWSSLTPAGVTLVSPLRDRW